MISRSGSISIPVKRRVFAASASRKPFAPQVIAYWLMSARIARQAASLISSGHGKSGNPCARFTAPCASACRVISRMTDSENCRALAERRAAAEGMGSSSWRGIVPHPRPGPRAPLPPFSRGGTELTPER